MEGNTRSSYQFVITEKAYIYCSTPKKELFQIITQKWLICSLKKYLNKELNYILIYV